MVDFGFKGSPFVIALCKCKDFRQIAVEEGLYALFL